MLMYMTSELNYWMRSVSGSNNSMLYLMDGEIPTSIQELEGKFQKEMLAECVAAIQVGSRPANRFVQFLNKSFFKRVHGKRELENEVSFTTASLVSKKPTEEDSPLPEEYSKSMHYSRFLLGDFASMFSGGTYVGSEHSIMFSFDTPKHVKSIRTYSAITSNGLVATSVMGGRETPTDFEQLDNTLDLSSATEGQKVRVRDLENLPDALSNVVGKLSVDCIVVLESGLWNAKSYSDSFEWVETTNAFNLIRMQESVIPLNNADYVASKEKFKHYQLIPTFTSTVYISYRYVVPTVLEEDAPVYADLPKKTITWAVYIPDYMDSSKGNYKAPISGNAPMMLLDVGGPNAGKAVTLNQAVDVDHTSDLTLMNLKTFTGWMES